MGKFVFAYKGGSMATTPAEQEAAMAAWGGWFGQLGAAIIDAGNPFGTSTAVGADKPTAALTGYSVISADSLDDAAVLAKDCPVLASGGNVEIYEALDVEM